MKLMFVSLGCDKNLVDSEMMLGMLQERGYEFTDDEEEAQIAVVNTCCFIGDAKKESIDALLSLEALKKKGRLKVLIAAGCLAQRYGEEIRREIPGVDAVVGTMAIEAVTHAVERSLAGEGGLYLKDIDSDIVCGKRRVVTTGGHYAYLKLAEGCDKRCTYCVIPKVRGRYRSVPLKVLVDEAKELAEKGVKELILVAQETTRYGVDLYGKKSLAALLRELAKIPDIRWIRILYCYPEEIDEELADVMRQEEKVCRYLDIPIQHASDKVLMRMGRRTTKAQLEERIGMLREKMPDICLRTTLIAGFPGETEAEHEECLAFVKKMKFDRLGVFCYSREEDTPAAGMPGQIPERVKKKRRARLMELQQEIAFKKAGEMVGQVLTVMVEGKLSGEETYVARTYRDAPGVDGYLFFDSADAWMTGDFVKVRVTGSNEYDLIGEIWDESAE